MDSAVWPYIVASGALQLLYFALLVTAYRLLPLSVVYPVSRGVAPVLVLVIGIVALGHATSVGQVLGVCLVGAGILLVRGLKPTGRAGVVFGLVIACVIATYTLVDKRGITHAAALSYLEISMLAPALLYASIRRGHEGAARAPRRDHPLDPGRRRRDLRRLLPGAARSAAGRRGARRRRARDQRRRDRAPRRPLPRRAGRQDACRRRRGRRLRDRARLAHVTPLNLVHEFRVVDQLPRDSRIRFRNRIWFVVGPRGSL